MTAQILFSGDFKSYFEDMLKRQALWLFVHVPKTAGSSLNGELVPILAPSYHIFVDYTQVEQRPFNEMLDESVERFIAAARAKRYFYCTGHILAHHVAHIAQALPDVQPLTLLRDPVTRYVSDYRYQCSDMNPGNAQFRAAHPTIDSYIDLLHEHNKAAIHLVPDALREAGAAGPCIDHILAKYGFVGIQEQYALSLRLITTLAGNPKRPKVFKRVHAPTAENEIVLTAEQEHRIRAANALDIAIYEDMAARFRAISAALEVYLDVVDPLPAE
jgi:hypothetical protein